MSHHPHLTDEQIVEISQVLEDAPEWGFDSVATVMTHYRTWSGGEEPDPGYRCVYPKCDTRTSDPIAMWKHVHFGTKHGRSFGIMWRDLGYGLVANLVNRPEES